MAGALAGGSVVLGLLLGWAGARVEGGVLAPLEYLDQRYGPLAWLNVLVAAIGGRLAGAMTAGAVRLVTRGVAPRRWGMVRPRS